MRLRLIFSPLVLLGAATCTMHAADKQPDAATVSQQAKIPPRLATHAENLMAKDANVTGVKSRFFTISDKPYGVKGHAEFCQRSKGECEAEFGGNTYLPVTDKLIQLLDTVNRDVNKRIWPLADNIQYGHEYWTVPEAKEDGHPRGDCDDYTLTKRHILEAYLPKESMSVAFLDIFKKGVYSDSHAVLVVHTLEGDYILDNMSNKLKFPADNPTYVFRGITDSHDQKKWWKVSVPDETEVVRNVHYFVSAVKYGNTDSKLLVRHNMEDFKVAMLADPKPSILSVAAPSLRPSVVNYAFSHTPSVPVSLRP